MMTLKVVVVDVDGCLTDGKQYIDADGDKLFKSFHSRDIRAIRELTAAGVRVVAISADDWPGGAAWCERAGAEFVVARDKLAAVQELGYAPSEVSVIGDDAWDKAAMLWCSGLVFLPHDADASVLSVWVETNRWHRLNAIGGAGVIAEVVQWLRQNKAL